jgi:hypothetical protein
MVTYGLDRHASESTAPHTAVDKLTPARRRFTFGLKNSPDLLPLSHNLWIVNVAISLNISQSLDGLFGAANLGQPSRRFWQERKPDEQEDSGDELDAPSGAERCRARDERAAVAGEEHNQDTPFDCKLLNDDDAASLVLLRDLRQVDRYLRRGDSDADTIEDTPSNKLSKVLATYYDFSQ